MAGGVKGTAIESVVADVRRLLEVGRVRREALEVRLEPEDLALLEEKLLPSQWYPLGTYGRLMQLLLDVEGNGRLEYLIERGRRAADRIRKAGLYAQLTADRERWGDRLGALMVTLGPQMYRDTAWSYEAVPDAGMHWVIEIQVPPSFPDVCRHATQGFIEHVASHAAGIPIRVSSERATPGRIVVRGDPVAD